MGVTTLDAFDKQDFNDSGTNYAVLTSPNAEDGKGLIFYREEGDEKREMELDFSFREFGESVGFCFERNPDPEKKHEPLKLWITHLGEFKQVLAHHGGHVRLPANEKYYIFVASNGPCLLRLNLGTTVFRTHHDPIKKGILSNPGEE